MNIDTNATVVERIDLTEELIIFRVRPDAPIPDFIPGQYVALGIPAIFARPAHFPPETDGNPHEKVIRRAYSIGSAPTMKEHLEFYVAILPEGAFTSRLVLLHKGDRIFTANKISGTFTLNGVPSNRNLILVATGTGVAPFLSMLRTESTWSAERHITLVHGVRYVTDLAYGDELREYERCKTDQFRYFPIVSRGISSQLSGNGVALKSWNGYQGRVQRIFEEGIVPCNNETDSVFLCGNPAMIEEMEVLLIKQGFIVHTKKHPGNLHVEKYW